MKKEMRVPTLLRDAAKTYEQRNEMYGDNYKLFGDIMMALFPDGLHLTTPDEFNRFNMLTQCTGKLTRYAQMFKKGGHLDSAHDEIVYAAMLLELTEDPFEEFEEDPNQFVDEDHPPFVDEIRRNHSVSTQAPCECEECKND